MVDATQGDQSDRQTAERPTFTFECGVTVTLKKATNRLAIRHFYSEAVAWRKLFALGSLTKEQETESDKFSERYFLYLAGWCVEDDPPPAALEELEIIGSSASPHVRRARWVRWLLVSTWREAANFTAACLTVANG